MNKVFLCGNVGKDPELKEVGSTKMVSLSVATNSRIKKGDEWVDNTQWHNVIFWAKAAEYVAKNALKGDVITVSGEINYRKYTTQDGVEKSVTEIKADISEWPSITKRKPAVAPQSASGDTPPPPSNDLPF